MDKEYKATCQKCNSIVCTGFDKYTTLDIIDRNNICAYCNDRKEIKVKIEELENE